MAKFEPTVKDTMVLVHGRLSYVHLMEPAAPQGSDDKVYSCCVLIDESDKKSVAAIEKGIENAIAKGVQTKWNGKRPRKIQSPLRDGEEKEGEEFKGKVFFNAKARRRVAVVDRKKTPIMDEEEVYSGMWAIVAVNFFPYSNSGNNGVAAGLEAVLKTKDDESFAGGAGVKALDGVELDDEDDDDDDDLL